MIWRSALAAAVLLAVAACGSQNQAQQGVAPVYDSHTAFVLVAQDVPAGSADYYLFDFNQGLTVEQNADEIIAGLKNDPLDSSYMGVIGPDAKHNLAALELAMQNPSLQPRPQLTFIYLGPAEYEQKVRELVKPLEADLRYVVYP